MTQGKDGIRRGKKWQSVTLGERVKKHQFANEAVFEWPLSQKIRTTSKILLNHWQKYHFWVHILQIIIDTKRHSLVHISMFFKKTNLHFWNAFILILKQVNISCFFEPVLGKVKFDKNLKQQESPTLGILTGKKHRQIKLQRLEKVRVRAFGLLVHEINYS